MAGSGWEIVESEDFLRAVAQCGGAEKVDEVLAPILYGLHKVPEGFPETNTAGVRIAKTHLQMNGPDIVLSHTLWFRIKAELQQVELLWVEVTRPDDL